jgi:hypothetical protein
MRCLSKIVSPESTTISRQSVVGLGFASQDFVDALDPEASFADKGDMLMEKVKQRVARRTC